MKYLFDNLPSLADELKAVPKVLIRQVLVFPVLVVLIASVTFLVGDHCAAWQWWTAVGVVVAVPFRHGCVRGGLSAGTFLLWLYSVKLATAVFVTPGWPDILEYHLPAIRLLTEGWNPVTMATPESLQAFSGIDNSLMRHLFVLFMAKGCWYFSAEAFFFTHQPLNLLFPLFPFLFLPVLVQVLRLLAGRHWAYKATGVLVLMGVVFRFYPSRICWSALVDCSVCVGGVGLLLSMYEIMNGGKWLWPELVCHSFWMCTAKQTGMASCFVFWCVFSVVMLMKMKGKTATLKRLAIAFATISAMVAMVGITPYLTSLHRYGHPLYPHASADESKYPLFDFNTPQRLRNEDAAAMGYLGHFANAYMSPLLTRSYYKWKLDRHEFSPRCWSWEAGGHEERYAPTSWRFRFALWTLTLLLLIWGNLPARSCVLMCWLGLAAFPTYLLGSARFTPWLFGLALLVQVAVSDGWRGWRRRTLTLCLSAYCVCSVLPSVLFSGASLIDMSSATRTFLKTVQTKTLYVLYVPTQGKLPPPTWRFTEWQAGNVLLLKRMIPELENANLELIELSDENDSRQNDYQVFFNHEFHVSAGVDLSSYSDYRRIIAFSNRRARCLAYPKFIVKAYCLTFPRLLYSALTGFLEV